MLFSVDSSLYSQQGNLQQEVPSAIIILKDGAKLYSADDSFNRQVLEDHIVVKNSDISYRNKSSEDRLLQLTAKRLQNEEKKNLEDQVKLAEKARQKDALQKVKNEIDKFRERSQVFAKIDFTSVPSSYQFLSTSAIAKVYVAPGQNNNDFSKLYASADSFLVRQALDYLHSQKYTYYNNKSLSFCFSEVFSVRPPPVLG